MSTAPGSDLAPKPRNDDEEQLKLLSIFHYVVGGIMAFMALLPLIYLVVGVIFAAAPAAFSDSRSGSQPPAFVGWILIAVGGMLFLLGEALATCVLLAGRFMAQRRRYTFVFVVSCVECLFMPFGTVLGVFTILVLSRESVKAQFAASPGRLQ
jgi:hypothetical protein